MTRLDPGLYRKAAERCRRQAISLGNSNEWVGFSLAWEGIAVMAERLGVTAATALQRPSGPEAGAAAR